MKNMKPIVLLSFLFFASVIAEPLDYESSNEVADLDNSDDFYDEDQVADADYDDENEDIIFGGMVSAKPQSPPPKFLPSAPSLIKAPPPCKKWRCQLNGYTPIWLPSVSSYCKDNYDKLGIMAKANCQDQFCQKVCASF